MFKHYQISLSYSCLIWSHNKLWYFSQSSC